MTITAPELVETRHSSRLAYRPAIDGLRGIAVLSVFLYHLNSTWLPGGFVGVDVFFVISGFLITSIIQKDCTAGTFSLARFYQRRIARIFPAFFTVALATIAAAWFVYTPQDFAFAGSTLVTAALSFANIKFMAQGDYFAISPDAQPYLHYWSLSVEEQFYIFFPLLLVILYKYFRKAWIGVLAGMGIISFALCIALTWLKPTWAFYLLPTRAWELLAGCVLALATNDRPAPDAVWRRWSSLIGLGLIVASFVLIHEGPRFPGFWALLPVAGAIAVLLPVGTNRSPGERTLAFAPLVLVGQLSYSLYLWHWPVFSLVDYGFLLESDGFRLGLKIVLSFALAGLSYWLIEGPARIRLNRPENMVWAYVLLIGVLLINVPLGRYIRANYYIDARRSDVARGGLVFPAKPDAPRVVLLGDSHGSMYGTLLRDVCRELGYTLVVLTVNAQDPLPFSDGRPNELWNDSLRVIRSDRPEILVIACAWNSRLRDDAGRLPMALQTLAPLAGRVILLNQPPILPEQANRRSIREGARPPFFEPPRAQDARTSANALLAAQASESCLVLDVAGHFLKPSGEVEYLDERGRQLYYDGWHLSGEGTERLRPMLLRALAGQ